MKNTIILAMLAVWAHVSVAQERPVSTEKPTLIAATTESKPKVEKVKITIPANIEYPSILSNHVAESKEYIENYAKNRREHIIRLHNKGKKMLPKVAAILKKYNLPTELKVLIALESGYNPNARSGAGAFGYWQFMDAVAKEYGLNIITPKDSAAARLLKKKDDRTNFQKSTSAAARYLRDRSKNFNNDWLIIVASYNYGMGNVREAIRNSGMENPTFWDIKRFLPAETRNYVMNFIAVNVVFNNYDKFLTGKMQFSDKEIEQIVTADVPAINAL